MNPSSNPLHIFICLYEAGDPAIITSVFIGEEQWISHPMPPDKEPDGMIDIYYADAADLDEDDLRRAADDAVAPAKELYYRRWLNTPNPKGAVTLVPRQKWKGHAQQAIDLAVSAVNRMFPPQKG